MAKKALDEYSLDALMEIRQTLDRDRAALGEQIAAVAAAIDRKLVAQQVGRGLGLTAAGAKTLTQVLQSAGGVPSGESVHGGSTGP